MEGVDSLYANDETSVLNKAEETYQMATIGSVEDDGVTLIFDGEDSPTEKHYKVNTGAVLEAGQRVVIQSIAGSYVVMFPVGSPSKISEPQNYIPPGGSDGQILTKNGSTDYSLKWSDAPKNYIPAGGTDGQVLAKSGSTAYSIKWVDLPENHIPTGGTDGQMLVKNGSSAYSLKWADAPKNHIPTGGTDGQVLTKSGSTAYSLKWADAPTNHIPTGGTDGQMLVKNGSTAYSLKWSDAPKNYIPTGGTDGQVLTKNGTTNYSVKWAAVPASIVSKLTSGSNTLTLSTKTLTPSATGFAIGTSSYPIAFHGGSVRLYYSAYKYCTLACNSSGKLTVDGTAIN